VIDREKMLAKEKSILKELSESMSPVDLFHEREVRQIFPEYEFTEPYGVWTGGIPLYAVLPFYRQLIVHLDPLPDSSRFKEVYGFTVKELAELRHRGRLIILLRAHYSLFPEFYDPLLEDHVPLNTRFESIFAIGSGAVLNQYEDELRAKYSGEKNPLPPGLTRDVVEKATDGDAFGYALRVMAQRMSKLEILGLGEEATQIVREHSLDEAYSLLHAWNRAIAVPSMDALGGWDNLDTDHLDLVNHVAEGSPDNRILLPREVMFWFTKASGYRYPTEAEDATAFLESVEETDEAAENHEILLGLQEHLATGDFNTCVTLAERSSKLLKKLKARMLDIERTATKLRKWVGTPVRFAVMPVTAISFTLVGAALSANDLQAAVCWGAVGTAAESLRQQTRKIEEFLTTLRHGRGSVPVLLWKRFRGRASYSRDRVVRTISNDS